MILPAVRIFLLGGSLLFVTPGARHLILTEQQSRNSTAEPDEPGQHLWFGHVEEKPESVKSFASKQFDTTSIPIHVRNESSAARDENDENGSWKETGEEFEASGSGEDLQGVEEPKLLKQRTLADSNDEENVRADENGRENAESEQSGETPDSDKNLLSATKHKDKNNGDNGEFGSVDSAPTGENEPAEDVEEEDNSNDQKSINNSHVIIESKSGDKKQPENVEDGFSSHINGLINNSTVTHVVESTGDQHQAEDEEEGGDLHSENLDNSNNAPHFVAEYQAQAEGDSKGRKLSNNTVTNILESPGDLDQAEDEKEKEGNDSATHVVEATDNKGEEERDTKGEKLNNDAGDKERAEVEEDDHDENGSDLNSKKLAPHIVKPTEDKYRAEEKVEDENGSDSNSKKLKNAVAPHIVKPAEDKDRAEDDEESDSNSKRQDNSAAPLRIVKPTGDKDRAEDDEESDSNSKRQNNNAAPLIVKPTGDKDRAEDGDESDSNSKRQNNNAAPLIVKPTGDKDRAEDDEESDSNSKKLNNDAASTGDKDREEEEVSDSNSKKLNNEAAPLIVKPTGDKDRAEKDEEESGSNSKKLNNDAASTGDKDRGEEEEESDSNSKKLNNNAAPLIVKPTGDKDRAEKDEEESDSNSKKMNNDAASTGDKDRAEDEEESDSNSKRPNNDAVVHELETTDEAENPVINDVRKQEDTDSKSWKMRNSSHVTPALAESSGDKDQPKIMEEEGNHSNAQNVMGATEDNKKVRYFEEDPKAKKELNNKEMEMNEKPNQDESPSGEYDDLNLLSSGTNEHSFSEGNQLETASLISSKPGQEKRVARAKIYRPENQENFENEDQDEDAEDSASGSYFSPEEFSDYVFDDSDIEQDTPGNFQLENKEEENAVTRDWVGMQAKDWEDSERSGAGEGSGLEKDYERDEKNEKKSQSEKGTAAHLSLKHKHHSQKTQEILASLENEIFSDGKNELKIQSTKKSGQKSKAHPKKRIHESKRTHQKTFKLHHKYRTALSRSTAHGVHRPHTHESTSKFSPSGIVPSVMSPVTTTSAVVTVPMVVAPAVNDQSVSKFTYHELDEAQQKGAVCIDGSTPRYYFRQGFGDGQSNWIIYLQGGAWCESKKACLERSATDLGSSLYFKDVENPGGLLSGAQKDNPSFFNWNVVYVPYCDGSSFAGNRSDPVEVEGEMLYFRGKRILSAAMDDLLKSGMQHAREVVLSGTSAGGLAVMLHTDYIRQRLPTSAHLHSLADSGFFLDIPTRKGKLKFQKVMRKVFKLHHCASGVNQRCVSSTAAEDQQWKCIFPQYFLSFVKSPLYLVNPIYDSWQLENVYHLHCAYHLDRCTKKQKEEISKFGRKAMKVLSGIVHHCPTIQMFADACVDHGQVVSSLKWNSIKVKNKSISGAFTEWYKHKKRALPRSVVDSTELLANPTCV